MKAGASQPRKDPYMDLTRIKGEVGYEPQYNADKAIDDYVAWLQSGNAE
jgi:nucleoside-diphosphate-sugar epimerase